MIYFNNKPVFGHEFSTYQYHPPLKINKLKKLDKKIVDLQKTAQLQLATENAFKKLNNEEMAISAFERNNAEKEAKLKDLLYRGLTAQYLNCKYSDDFDDLEESDNDLILSEDTSNNISGSEDSDLISPEDSDNSAKLPKYMTRNIVKIASYIPLVSTVAAIKDLIYAYKNKDGSGNWHRFRTCSRACIEAIPIIGNITILVTDLAITTLRLVKVCVNTEPEFSKAIEFKLQEIETKSKEIEEKRRELEEKRRELENTCKELKAKRSELAEMRKNRKLEELEEKRQYLDEWLPTNIEKPTNPINGRKLRFRCHANNQINESFEIYLKILNELPENLRPDDYYRRFTALFNTYKPNKEAKLVQDENNKLHFVNCRWLNI